MTYLGQALEIFWSCNLHTILSCSNSLDQIYRDNSTLEQFILPAYCVKMHFTTNILKVQYLIRYYFYWFPLFVFFLFFWILFYLTSFLWIKLWKYLLLRRFALFIGLVIALVIELLRIIVCKDQKTLKYLICWCGWNAIHWTFTRKCYFCINVYWFVHI